MPAWSRPRSKKRYPVTMPMRMASMMDAAMPSGSRYVTLSVRSVRTRTCRPKLACFSASDLRLRCPRSAAAGNGSKRCALSSRHAALRASTRALLSCSSSGVRLSTAAISMTCSAGFTNGGRGNPCPRNQGRQSGMEPEYTGHPRDSTMRLSKRSQISERG